MKSNIWRSFSLICFLTVAMLGSSFSVALPMLAENSLTLFDTADPVPIRSEAVSIATQEFVNVHILYTVETENLGAALRQREEFVIYTMSHDLGAEYLTEPVYVALPNEVPWYRS